jgi:modulator of FtsH protease
VQLFVQLPGGTRTYAVAGLAVFAALVAFDFQRLRRDSDLRSAPLLAASIFLDGLNVLQFFMLLLRNGSR